MIRIEGLNVSFAEFQLRDIDLHIAEHQFFVLMGPTGAGKTVLLEALAGLVPVDSGRIFLGDREITNLPPERRGIGIVYQDSALFPHMTVGENVAYGLMIKGVPREERDNKAKAALAMVKLAGYEGRRPVQLSGGQRQRVAIARALAVQPSFIVCDEPISALDVSIQAQVLNLLQQLQERLGLTLLFIAHDLSVVEHVSNRIAVMYVGKIVEMAGTEEVLRHPLHPYAEALISAVPPADPDIRLHRIILEGEVASPTYPPAGCIFHPRCRYAENVCSQEEPQLIEVEPDHYVSCHFAAEWSLQGIGS